MEPGFRRERNGRLIYHGHLDKEGQEKIVEVAGHTRVSIIWEKQRWYVQELIGLTEEQHPVPPGFERYRESRSEYPIVAINVVLGPVKFDFLS